MPPNHSKAMPVLIITLILACSLPCPAAQPDAGRLLQEQRQQVPQVPQRPPQVIEKDGERAPLGDTGAKVLVQGFVFSGIEGLATEAELAKVVADAIGSELGFAELQALAERITRYLRDDKGYLLARAYLPKQDITGGIIEIAVIAGRIEGKARIDVKPPSRIRPGLLEGIAGRSVAEDRAARLKDIERAVLLMNDLPGISAHASLERGETPGSSRLVITAREGLEADAVLAFDNYGDRYTGVRRGIVQLSANDPCGLGDQLSVGLTLAKTLYQARGAYSLPLGTTGATWSLYASHLGYELGSDMEDLDADGSARTLGSSLGYPLLRARAASLWVGVGYERLVLKDEALGSETRTRRLPVGNASLTGSFFDRLGGGGISSLTLELYRGDLDISPTESEEADAMGP
ncbi:MAG TPA: POTRA domain-containing protein, partial [Deltaproteobacteria bacterium]|nr:POTRA domain-containing protein [Deltaproteobacteria bacterium]